MQYVLLVISVAVTLGYNLLRNRFSKHNARNQTDFHSFNAVCSLFSAAALLIFALVSGAPAPGAYTLLMGLAFGVLTALAALFNMRAFECGPASYTTLIITASMMIPALSGPLFFNEGISAPKLAGCALMLVSLALSVCEKGQNRKANLRWFLLCLAAMLCSGGIGIMQKLHQNSPHASELMYFLVTAFTVSTVYSAAALVFYKLRGQTPQISYSPRRPVVYMSLASGVAIAAANVINLYLSGVMPSIVFFPTVNGANLLLMLLISTVFLKERLSLAKWIGIAVGCAAIALLCIG